MSSAKTGRAARTSGLFAGVDIGGTRIKVGLADDTGTLLSSHVLDSRNCRDAASLIDMIVDEIGSQASTATAQVAAAGVGCPGRIDFTSGRVVWLKTKLEFLEGIPLAARLGNRLECPVACDNDVNATLAGEMRFGAGRGFHDVTALTVGTGIGGALVLNGQMVRGRNWATGHFGYMSLDPWGPQHICGNTGIVEEHASLSGILRELRGALGDSSQFTKAVTDGEEPGLRELFEVADAGDELARRLAERMLLELGVLIANLVYAFDPELVLIGGGLITHRPRVLDAIRNQALSRLNYLPEGATKILPMALGDASGVVGGAALAMDLTHHEKVGLRA
jgi:glucokinase